MRIKEILLIALSVVLIVCLVLLGRSCVAERAAILATPEPTAAHKPIPTFAPSPTPKPTPVPTPVPTPPPFAEEMGFRFEEPQTHTVPAVQSSSLKEEISYSPVGAIVSAPQITRSEPDAEGYVTWGIRYSTTADANFTLPSDKSVEAFRVFAGGYDLFDYETGRMLNSRDAGDLGDGRTYTRETQLPAGPVLVTEEARCTWDEWQFAKGDGLVTATNQAVVEAHLTVRAPADYDGLILGLDVVNAQKPSESAPGGGTPAAESPEIWEGRAEDWVFVRADDWLSALPPEETAEEAPAEAEEEAEPEDELEEEELSEDGLEEETDDAEELPEKSSEEL